MNETNALAPKVFVFDMGQVLLHFDGHEFSSLYVDGEEDAALLDAALFSSPTWSLLDAGVISEATMERVASSHLPERLWPALHECFANWDTHQRPIPDTNELVVRLHDAGYACYLLSNAGVRWWHQKDRIPSFPVMDGWVVSAWERLMKPDPLIYKTLCDRYELRPEECLFIDDSENNVRGAKSIGMQGHVFTTAARLEAELEERGISL